MTKYDEVQNGRKAKFTYLHIFQAILLTDAPQYVFLATLLHFSGQQQLVKYEVGLLEIEYDVQLAHVAIVFVHLFYISMNDLESDELVVCRGAAGDEEERSISPIDHFGIWVGNISQDLSSIFGSNRPPLYSRKLHMRVRLDRTSWETSLIIFAFSRGERVVNHFASR